jgi:glutamine amidotransferase
MIAIVDYEIGNLAAIANMFNRLGVQCEITADPVKIENAEKIVLPGNGAFDACMQSLRATG